MPKTTTLHLGSSRSGLYLLCHLIQSFEGMEFHEGLIVGLSLCQNAQSIIYGCLQGPGASQKDLLVWPAQSLLPCKARWKQELSGHFAAKQPQLKGKAANPVHMPVCKLDLC